MEIQATSSPKVLCDLAIFEKEGESCGIEITVHNAIADKRLTVESGVMAALYDTPIELILETYFSDHVVHITMLSDKKVPIGLSKSITTTFLADNSGQIWSLIAPSPRESGQVPVVFAQGFPVFYKGACPSVELMW